MKITYITVGEPKGNYHSIFTEYAKRISRFAKIDIHHIKENKDSEKKILKAIGKSFVVLFDEKGRDLTSMQLADFIEQKEISGISDIAFIIGGTDGHTDAVRKMGNYSLALSKLTFPHDLAMTVGIEALYRALTIIAGHPYHRA